MSSRKLRPKTPAGVGYPSAEAIRANPVPKIAQSKGSSVITVLAFDLSSSCVGWALGMNKTLTDYGKFVFKSDAGIAEKLSAFREFLDLLCNVYEPDVIVVEKPMNGRGNTTARHYEILGVVKELVFTNRRLEIKDVWVIPALRIKSLLRVDRSTSRNPRDRHDENKLIMCRKVNDLYGLKLKFHKNSKIESEDDIADAIAVLTAYYRLGKE